MWQWIWTKSNLFPLPYLKFVSSQNVTNFAEQKGIALSKPFTFVNMNLKDNEINKKFLSSIK